MASSHRGPSARSWVSDKGRPHHARWARRRGGILLLQTDIAPCDLCTRTTYTYPYVSWLHMPFYRSTSTRSRRLDAWARVRAAR